ncbi:MAG: Rpn family recombination-promoting nuclease/putative transposase [Dysgonamonadaceae bacterium]|jgi:predicted transposase/invertase (TIGR01784 family)|nr:Rpn family recombination-promoting nuclease/putative transposase [Dysgonamonadaceae bacterium]
MKENERPNPLNDYLFVKYMGEEGDEEQLLAFLNVVLQKTGRNANLVKIITDRQIPAKIEGAKASVLDVRAVINDRTKVNIEVQLRAVGNMDKRSLYYWSCEYSKGIHAGDNYNKLPQVVVINILGAEFLPIDEVHSSFHLWEDEHKDFMLTDVLEMHFIDMVKFRRLKEKDIEGNPLHRWLAFFDKNTNENTLKKIITMEPAIEKAMWKIGNVLQDEDMLRIYESREMAAMDYNSGMDHALNKGKQEGILIGKQEGILIGKQEGILIGVQKIQRQYVLKLAQAGKTVAEIAEFTGLPAETVKNILIASA